MENLAAFSAREVKRSTAEERERSIPLQMDNESRGKRKVILMSFLKIEEKGDVCWGERAEKGGQLVRVGWQRCKGTHIRGSDGAG